MASSGYTTLQLYHTETPGVEPAAGNLIAGELAINTADGKLFYKNTSGTVSTITSGGGSGGSGYSGYSGYSGLGLSGYSGYSGQNGASASSGYSGYSGQTGASGISGYSGSGISGFSGYSGAGGGGSVTSVNAFGGVTGLTFSGGPITTSGTLTLGGTLGISGGGTNTQTAPTAGGVAFGTGTAYAFTTVGTAGQFLISNAASNPTWASLTSSNVTNALGYTPPTSTGSGATGTWPINISGLAASASYATAAGSATTASSATNVTGVVAVANGGTGATSFASAGLLTTSTGAQLSGTNNFTGTNNYSNTASITATGTNAGNQRIGVTYSTYSSGLSATSLQLAGAGVGVLFDTNTNSLGLLNGFGGGSGTYFSVTPPSGSVGLNNSTIYTSAVDAYKGGSSTSWIATSDIRLKSNIQDYTKGLDLLKQIKPRTWVYNGKGGSTKGSEGLGVVADEIEQVLPSVIKTVLGKLNPEDTENTNIKHVDTTEITWLLVNAVKELAAEIATLKANK
jgi:hypothetical protein